MHDYKCLRVAVMIGATVVNTQTHQQTDRQLLTVYMLLAQLAELKRRLHRLVYCSHQRGKYSFVAPDEMVMCAS